MLRECVRLAHEDGRVVVFVEPIALYHTTDLHQPEDGGWTAPYIAPDQDKVIAQGALGQSGKGTELAIITYGNGYFLSRQASSDLEASGMDLRIIDLRWLHPFNAEAFVAAVAACKKILIGEVSRRSGSLTDKCMNN